MSQFTFYLGDDSAIINNLRSAATFVWGETRELTGESFCLLMPTDDYDYAFCEWAGIVGAISGYARCENLKPPAEEQVNLDASHSRRFLRHILDGNNWPLQDGWTGSFVAIAHSKTDREIVLCNDIIGYRPLYYSDLGKGFIGGTSLIVLGRCLSGRIDIAGLLQRITPPFCNYGRRTMLENVNRLLPGEWLKFNSQTGKSLSLFDNSLCKGLIDSTADMAARTVWDCFQREALLAIEPSERIFMAMSGGWDSRLVLGAISHKADAVTCYTYGDERLYESRLAKRCAEAIGANHECFPIDEKYFPSQDDFKRLVRQTEFANHMQWFAIIDSISKGNTAKDKILLGDLCETIDGRNISSLSSRTARRKSYIGSLYGKQDQISAASSTEFNLWKEKQTEEVMQQMLNNLGILSDELASSHTQESLREQLAYDLDQSFLRVRDNMPAFTPMFDEVFAWFHKGRYQICSQALLLASTFRPICPPLSTRFIRLISTVHPRLRIRRKLMDAIARLPEFDRLSRIPSSQIPWLHARIPSLLREFVWGARSALDQALMKRVLESRNLRKRQRVLPSLDFIREYQREETYGNVEQWFEGKLLNGNKYLEIIRKRAEFAAWPLINIDIAAPANANVLINFCRGKSITQKKAKQASDFQPLGLAESL